MPLRTPRSSGVQFTSNMQRASVGRENRLVHHLRECGMREDHRLEIGIGGFQRTRDAVALDQLRYFRADHVRTQELTRIGIEDRLDEAFDFAKRDGLAVADEREFPDLDLASRLARFRL